MASKQFLAALEGKDLSKPVEIVVAGTEYLTEGVHNVTVTAVDINQFDNDRVGFTFATEDGKTHNEMVFLTDSKSGGLSLQLSRLLTGAFGGDSEANQLFLQSAAEGKSWGVFVGMKIQVRLAKPNKGYEIKTNANKLFGVYDRANGELFPESEKEDYAEAVDFIKANNLKRAYLRMTSVKATAKEANIGILKTGLGNIKQRPIIAKSI